MLEPINLIRGLPDDGKVHLLETGPPFRVAYEGTASFLAQMGRDLPWNTIWVGPGTHRLAKLLPGPVVNYIADPDLCAAALRIASANAARHQRPWFNHPDRIIASTREQVSGLLQGIDGLIAPRVARCRPTRGRDIVSAIEDGALRYPVLVRSAGEHGGRTLVRVDGPDAERAFDLSASTGKDLYLTEFHDFADDDGLYRRYRFAVVGGEAFIKSVVMGSHWNLHASSRIWDDRTIAQERQILDSFDTDLAPRIKPVIDAIHDRLGLDYFGIDCAVGRDGSIVLFEANATMNILVDIKLQPDLWSGRTDRIKSALISLLKDPARWVAARPRPAPETPAEPTAATRPPLAPPAGPTAADILAGCREELRLRDGLATSDAGQVADSYDTLHSVRLVTLILETIPTTLSDASRSRYLFFLLASLFDANLAGLCDWARRDVQEARTSQAANTLQWIERLLRLKHDIGLFSPLAAPGSHRRAQQPASGFPPALDALGEALLAYFGQTGFPAIAAEDAIVSADAMLFHRAKNITLLAREDSLGAFPDGEIAPDIVAAHLDCVAATAAGLRMKQSTHIGQFCLLHQVPELIVPTVLRLWTAIEADLDAADPHGALEHAQAAGDLLSIMVLSIAPLAEILYPSEYFKFRGNLGATSGSSSAAIRGKLLTTAYVRLAERVVAASLNGAGRAHDRLMAQLSRNRELLYKWRALHIALPRNVLGSDGTKSLVGSPDALKAVRTMADAFAGKDPLTAILGPVVAAGFAAVDAVERLDAALLSETGRVARDQFWQVQERVGTWAKNKQTA